MTGRAAAVFDQFRGSISALVASPPAGRARVAANLRAERLEFARDLEKAARAAPDHAAVLLALRSRGEEIIGSGCTTAWRLARASASHTRDPRLQIAFFAECTAPGAAFQQRLDANQRQMVADLMERTQPLQGRRPGASATGA